jgi:hypothetical protein
MKSSGTRSGLDSTVAEIELTLISIIQGVALTFLIESAHHVINQIVFWPYVLAGLLVILIFWSRSVLHIITVIRWPLEFGHNFLYIACALTEAVLFTRLQSPRAWFALGALYAAIVWLLFVYDLRLIHARERDSAGQASNRLYALVTKDQWLNIGLLIPMLFALNLACAALIYWHGDFFLQGHGHVWLAIAQLVAFGIYLVYVLRFFKRLAPLIEQAREEWNEVAP